MKFSSHTPKIVVVGSSSIDLVLTTEHHPFINETVLATQTDLFLGGKGANQAVGTSRLGAQVYLVGCVGRDANGASVLENLEGEGIDVGFVHQNSTQPTGTAYVTYAHGNISIVVVPAANNFITTTDIDKAETIIKEADLVLTQLEIPIAAVNHLFNLCEKSKTRIGLYASPAKFVPAYMIEASTFIVAKSNDLSVIFGEANDDKVLKRLPNKLFIRDGINSTLYFNGEEMKYYRKEPATTAHKMGMGDAFTSGFAIAFCHGNEIRDCVRFGNEVALKVSASRGSQTGLPYLEDFNA
ncbi:ribokinase [Elizabethkingia argentiflava]|uniref:Ribokinase n=1 Tax=Elizabethkingia argenteiflava TaxID=2681556 RepID=A0A845PY81_9FLAO|nr:ribokinase [Elizabethkingia argenteiflava]NAW51318.1 ribokinase [Elizabethkingia argenteiflava]